MYKRRDEKNGLMTLTFDLLSFDLESGVRITCDVGYFRANFGLPRPLCSRLYYCYYY